MPSEAGPAGTARAPCSCSGSAGAAEAPPGIGVNVWGMDAGARPGQDPVVTPLAGDSGSLPRICDMFMTYIPLFMTSVIQAKPGASNGAETVTQRS